jgi:hypothetical protein
LATLTDAGVVLPWVEDWYVVVERWGDGRPVRGLFGGEGEQPQDGRDRYSVAAPDADDRDGELVGADEGVRGGPADPEDGRRGDQVGGHTERADLGL